MLSRDNRSQTTRANRSKIHRTSMNTMSLGTRRATSSLRSVYTNSAIRSSYRATCTYAVRNLLLETHCSTRTAVTARHSSSNTRNTFATSEPQRFTKAIGEKHRSASTRRSRRLRLGFYLFICIFFLLNLNRLFFFPRSS